MTATADNVVGVANMTSDGDELLDLDGVAEYLGVGEASVRTYHNRATANRREGNPLPGDLPAPDFRFSRGRCPVWLRSTLDGWERPGRGTGGGPKPKAEQ